MQTSCWLGLVIASVVLSSCGGSVSGQSDGGVGMGGSIGQGGSGPGGNGQGGTGQGGEGPSCGARLGDTCAANQYCDFPDDRCGSTDRVGSCRHISEQCPLIYQPTCACDGKIYGNACEATWSRTDVSTLGCAPPPDRFSCGPRLCSKTEEYCQRTVSDVGSLPDSYECLSIPPSCRATPPPTCACLVGDASWPSCSADSEGNLTVVYPGG
jgi:hypothetical protein